jgi:hypothetical protein
MLSKGSQLIELMDKKARRKEDVTGSDGNASHGAKGREEGRQKK